MRKRSLLCMVMGICLLAGSVAGAFWSVSGSSGNIVTMGTYQNRIVEEYTEPQQVIPKQTVKKRVSVSNTGNVDTFIRVKVEKKIGTEKEDGTFEEDTSLDPEMIEIICDTQYWKKQGDYYYYKEILKAGTTTQKPLFEEYTLSEKAGNAYKKKSARIIVTMESIQAEGDGIGTWGITYDELGVTKPAIPQGEDRVVQYRGHSTGFAISEATTDLFASFKELVPGCCRTQKIIMKNDSNENVEFFLHAEEAKQFFTNAAQKNEIEQLLKKNAQIQIKEGDRVIYQGPLDGNLEKTNGSMGADISLGKFKANEERVLTVSLALSPDMTLKSEKITGRVKWIFTAKGEDVQGNPPVQASVPKTGDPTEIGMWVALFAASGVFIYAAYLIEKKERRREAEHEARRRNF